MQVPFLLRPIIAATIYIVLLIAFEFIEFKSKLFKRVAVGEAIVIISNGRFIYENLKRLRLTEEEAKSHVRQAGIPKLSYIEQGTIEPNGEFGFRLTCQAEPLRVEDMEYILNNILSDETKKRVYIDLAHALENKNP